MNGLEKNMKKLLSLIIPMLFVGSIAFAQAFTHKYNVNLVSPAANATIANGANINQSIIVTLTLGGLTPADTLVFSDPFVPSGQVWIGRVGSTYTQGDTVMLDKAYKQLELASAVSMFSINPGHHHYKQYYYQEWDDRDRVISDFMYAPYLS